MKTTKILGMAFLGAVLTSSAAFAKTTDRGVVTPLPKAITLADNVVVTPQATPAPAPAPQNNTTVVPAQQPQPAQSAPAAQNVNVEPAASPARRTVHTEHEPKPFMSTIVWSAFLGGLGGALIGGAVYFLDDQENPERIGYWAAGGVLVGTAVGIVNVATDESRAERAVSSRTMPRDPVPTFRLSLLQGRF
jgi:hypothetical protein